MSRLVRIGTRSSQLSLWQAHHVAALIQRHHRGARVELREYRTRGDRLSAQPLPSIGGKGVFTQALEVALLKGEIDCAAHSLKDLPVAETPGLALAAIPQRGDHRDALVSRQGEMLAQLRQGARIGTGSPRRRAQLLWRCAPTCKLSIFAAMCPPAWTSCCGATATTTRWFWRRRD